MIGIKRVMLLFFLIVFFAGVYVFLEPFFLQEKYIVFPHSNIPPQFRGTRIVFLTDIHHGPFFSKERLGRLVERVNDLHPHIVLLGGDYVHRSSHYIEHCFDELGNLETTLGSYGVLGNHDHWEDAALTRECMVKAGIRPIDNAAYWIGKDGGRIKVGGVGDYLEDVQDIEPMLDGVGDGDFTILVTHNPDYVEDMMTDKIDLVLAGHTHGGQVTFFGLWAPFTSSKFGQRYRTGIVETGRTRVIISNGIGTITPPVRFFARPQIIIIDLLDAR